MSQQSFYARCKHVARESPVTRTGTPQGNCTESNFSGIFCLCTQQQLMLTEFSRPWQASDSRAGKKLAKLLRHGLGQHAQDVEIHGQILGDSTAMKLRFHAVKPGNRVRRPWGGDLDRGRVDFGGNKSLSAVGHCSARQCRNSVCSRNSPQPCLDPANQNGTMAKGR